MRTHKKHMQSKQFEYCKYFARRQKVSLINMSAERNRDNFESFSGYVVACGTNKLELHIPYPTDLEYNDAADTKTSFKLTTESLGSGIQVMSDLVEIVSGNIFQLKLRDNPELFRRCAAPRINTSINLYHLRKDLTLAHFRKEWRRVLDYLNTKGLPSKLVLRETPINLSIGGICLAAGAETPTPLSMFFLDLNDGMLPVCALAETVWKGVENNRLLCGHRFINISKADQKRIDLYIQSIQKKTGVPVTFGKKYWDLLDQMTFEYDASKLYTGSSSPA